MATHVTNRSWTDADIKRLRMLSAAGASVSRAAAALNRRMTAVQKIARVHKLPLVGIRQAKATIRQLDQAR